MEEVVKKKQRLDIQDERTPGGVLQYLPLEIIKIILEKLPPGEIIKTRELSKWYEEIVTGLFLNLFDTPTVPSIDRYNCASISVTLSKAMYKPHFKDTKLKLQFEEDLTSLMKKEMLICCKKNIVALDIKITRDDVFLLEPSLTFDFLERLTIKTSYFSSTNERRITESMIGKHATKLKKLHVKDGTIDKDSNDGLNVPALPNLVSLTMYHGDVPFDFPEIPQLIELNLSVNNDLHILSKYKESLKCLVTKCFEHEQSLDKYALVMPQLTDLFLIDYDECSKFLSYNQKSLEFLFLSGCTLTSNHWFGVRMERVKTVVIHNVTLMVDYALFSMDYDEDIMAQYCPNADVIIWDGCDIDYMVELYHKRRGFTLDLNDVFRNL